MAQIRFGFVGTGMIAEAMAAAMEKSSHARLVAVSSRKAENARAFIAKIRSGSNSPAAPVEGVEHLLTRPDVDAVYIASPTTAKESIALRAIDAGKHVLVEKPFINRASVERMTRAAAARNVLFMDATHFVHHSRTRTIIDSLSTRIGHPRSLHTTLYFPNDDRSNIRFDRNQEPMGALGDLGWYSARAIVEYLDPKGPIVKASTAAEFDALTGAVIRASGLVSFASGESSTFDVGFTAGTVLMDLQLLGTTGVIGLDDFVLDWTSSWAFRHPTIPTGFSHRTAAATRRDVAFHTTPASKPQEVQMIDSFAQIALSSDERQRSLHASATHRTQDILDAMWAPVANVFYRERLQR